MKCAAILDRESEDSNGKYAPDQLVMYKTHIQPPPGGGDKRYGYLDSTTVAETHKGDDTKDGGAEESGKYLVLSKRHELSYGYVKYEVGMKVVNSTSVLQGMYACGLSRKHDRTFVAAWVRQGIPEANPMVEIKPCASARFLNWEDKPFVVETTRGQPTCVRCRASGYPAPDVTLWKSGVRVESNHAAHVHVDKHINGPDGGLPEVTLNLFRVSEKDAGLYICTTGTGRHDVAVNFKIVVN